VDSITKTVYYVTHIEDGEWLQYTLNVIKSGSYNLRFIFSAKDQAGKFSVLANKRSSQSIDIPKANDWEIIEVKKITLNKGQNILRLLIEQGGFDFKSIQFIEAE
jgi:hypothetical protein